MPSSLQVTLSRISSDVTAPDADLDTVDRYNFLRNRSKFKKDKCFDSIIQGVFFLIKSYNNYFQSPNFSIKSKKEKSFSEIG